MSKRDKAKVARQTAEHWLKNNGNDIDSLWKKTQHTRVRLHRDSKPVFDSFDEFKAFLAKKSDDILEAITIARTLNLMLPEIDVYDFKQSGYEPSVLLNYLALLGWHPGGNIPERFDMDWFVNNFTIEGIGKTNAKFDRAKLLTFNGEVIQRSSFDDFVVRINHIFIPPAFNQLSNDTKRWRWFLQAYHPRARTYTEPFELGRFFVLHSLEVEYDRKAIEKVLLKNNHAGLMILEKTKEQLQAHDDWTPPALHALLENFAAENKLSMGDVAQPLRVALTGTTVSPPMDLTLAILGKNETSARIGRCFNVAGF